MKCWHLERRDIKTNSFYLSAEGFLIVHWILRLTCLMYATMKQSYQQVFFLSIHIDCVYGVVRFVFCTYLPLSLKMQNFMLDHSNFCHPSRFEQLFYSNYYEWILWLPVVYFYLLLVQDIQVNMQYPFVYLLLLTKIQPPNSVAMSTILMLSKINSKTFAYEYKQEPSYH